MHRFPAVPLTPDGEWLVLLDHTSPYHPGATLHERMAEDFKGESTKVAPADTLDDLRRRNQAQASWRRYNPQSERVIVMRLDAFEIGLRPSRRPSVFDQCPDAAGWIRMFRPGYSRDGSLAIVRFDFGPTAHGAFMYMLLERNGTTWDIVWSKAVYYL